MTLEYKEKHLSYQEFQKKSNIVFNSVPETEKEQDNITVLDRC